MATDRELQRWLEAVRAWKADDAEQLRRLTSVGWKAA